MDIKEWIISNQETIITIVAVVAGAAAVRVFGGIIINKIVRRAIKSTAHKSKREERQREETISAIINGGLTLSIWPMALIIIISQLGVDVAPLIAGAGILGLAVGFGAQSLVKDVINGLFIIAENQYGVGDVVQINGEPIGMVERITLRLTVLRYLDGVVFNVPNGSIELTANYSKEKSGLNLNIGVSYDTDIEKAIKVINEACDDLTKDKDWVEHILEKPQFLRVDDFADSAVILKITGITQPLMQWDVTGELRKRIKVAFDKEGIEIPFPQRVIHQAK